MSIQCCRYCVPPKRHPQCWSTCPEYIEEKALADKRREEDHNRREIYNAIYDQRSRAARKASKKRRGCKLE